MCVSLSGSFSASQKETLITIVSGQDPLSSGFEGKSYIFNIQSEFSIQSALGLKNINTVNCG